MATHLHRIAVRLDGPSIQTLSPVSSCVATRTCTEDRRWPPRPPAARYATPEGSARGLLHHGAGHGHRAAEWAKFSTLFDAVSLARLQNLVRPARDKGARPQPERRACRRRAAGAAVGPLSAALGAVAPAHQRR